MRAVAVLPLLASVALVGCGDNDAGFEPWILETLDAADGVSVITPEFEVPAGEEIQDCYFFTIPTSQPGDALWVDRMQLALNPGSHHMNLFRVGDLRALRPADGEPIDLGGTAGTVVRGGECWTSANWANWALVANNQQSLPAEPILDWALPAGVATRFAPGETLMLQIHYVNAATQETPFKGRGGVNLHRSTDGDTMELGTLFATQQNIRICRSNPRPTYQGSCAMPAGTHTVAAVNGHFHSRGRTFSVYAWDGVASTQPPESDLFYRSSSWEEPEMKLGMSLPLPEGGGVWWTCEFQWIEPAAGCAAVDERDPLAAGDCCYTFGPIVETSEHCNVFLYYWPKTADVNCF